MKDYEKIIKERIKFIEKLLKLPVDRITTDKYLSQLELLKGILKQ